MGVIKCIEFEDREFQSKEEMFKALKDNEKQLISFKKSKIYKSKNKGQSVNNSFYTSDKIKSVNKNLFTSDKHYYIVVNTTNVLDSHGDFHDKGLWNKSSKEQSGKNYLVDTHTMSIDSTIAKKEDIEIFVSELPASMFYSDKEGDIEGLIYKVSKDKIIHEKAKKWLESGDGIQASVSMEYVTVKLAINSLLKEHKEEKEIFDKYEKQMINRGDFKELTHFWVIKEAKNRGESSLVLFGSNPATGVTNDEPSEGTQKSIEPSNEDIQEKERLEILRAFCK